MVSKYQPSYWPRGNRKLETAGDWHFRGLGKEVPLCRTQEVKLVYFDTNGQLADFFAKPLDVTKFIHLWNLLMAELCVVEPCLILQLMAEL